MPEHRVSAMAAEMLKITLSRPTADTRLGIRLASETPEDPPVVQAVAGVSSKSQLQVRKERAATSVPHQKQCEVLEKEVANLCSRPRIRRVAM